MSKLRGVWLFAAGITVGGIATKLDAGEWGDDALLAVLLIAALLAGGWVIAWTKQQSR